MPNLPQNLNQKHFKKMLSGAKGYLAKKVKDALKARGLQHSLYKGKVSKEEALRVLRGLREDKLSPKPLQGPESIYRTEALDQYEEDQAELAAERHKHVAVNIRMDIADEQRMIDETETNVLDEHKELLRKKYRAGEISRVEQEQERREKERKLLAQRRGQSAQAKGIDPKRPKLAEPPDLAID